MNTFSLLNDKEFKKKERALDRIFLNAHHNLRDAFIHWRSVNQIEAMNALLDDDKKA